jgi:hypothetical protein
MIGQLDPRLVADSKAHSVVFDAGAGQPKRVAEVTVKGMINSKPFELTRKRSLKKTELLFLLDGQDLTAQSVQDTQLLVDEILGTGSGLLQRSCFFGQHSHTMQVCIHIVLEN